MATKARFTTRTTRRTLQAGTALSGALLGLLLTPGAQAAPQGGQIVAGQATIRQVSPNEIDITQKSARLVLDWASFSLAAGETVRFIQGSNEVALNEIAGGPSTINGNLFADARLVLVNAAGITFGTTAHVQVGSLVATTAGIAVPDFLNGRYVFGRAGQSHATIINAGSITAAQGGLVALVAPGVVNSGTITARFGKVALASGNSFFLDLFGDHLVNLVVGDQVVGAQVSNSGSIIADGGRVQLSAAAAAGVVSNAINMAGVIQARAVMSQGGSIVLEGGAGSVEVAGTLDASGGAVGQQGGVVKVLGNAVTLDGTARVDVSGDSGGGTALIGGNFHGAGPEQNAQATIVAAGATIDADAVRAGQGGNVVVWADGATGMAGTITARGGALGGDGGVIETSGQGGLMLGTVAPDAGAAKGQAGLWLLDPEAVVIAATAGTTANGTTTLSASTVTAALRTNDVVIETNQPGTTGTGSITVESGLTYGFTHGLLLLSQGAITVAASIQNTLAVGGGVVALVAGWDGVSGGTFTTPLITKGVSVGGIVAAIQAAHGYGFFGGEVLIGGAQNAQGAAVGSLSGPLTVLARDVTLQGGSATGAFAQLGFDPVAAGIGTLVNATGQIGLSLTGGLLLMGGSLGTAFAQIGDGGANTALQASGAITVSAPGGSVVLQAGSSFQDYAQIGHGGDSVDASLRGKASLAGAITISAGGDVTLAGNFGGYAQIGHGGNEAFSGATLAAASGAFGAINLTAGGNLILTSVGDGDAGYAQIGHGGAGFGFTANTSGGSLSESGAITVGAASVSLLGNTGDAIDSYAQIGHGGANALKNALLAGINGNFGAIGLAASGGLTLVGGNGDADYAQIGHGGFDFGNGTGVKAGSLVNSGAITVGAASVFLQGGNISGSGALPAFESYAQIGHGGDGAISATLTMTGGNFGAISVMTGGGLTLIGGTGAQDYAQLGHGGFQFGFHTGVSAGGLMDSGAITVSAAAGVFLQGGGSAGVTGADAYAQIGHGGDDALDHAILAQTSGNFGAISVTTSGGLALAGGNGSDSYAQIGHGGFEFGTAVMSSGSLVNSGAITVGAASVSLQGSSTDGISSAYTQIGHGGSRAFFGAMLGGTPGSGNFGGIDLALRGNLSLTAGSGVVNYAQLGHGGSNFGESATVSGGSLVDSGAITVSAASVGLLGGSGGTSPTTSYAQIGHGGGDAFFGATLGATLGSSGNFGAISLVASGGLAVAGGMANFGYAQIGHGGTEFGMDARIKASLLDSGAITVGAASVSLIGGLSASLGSDAYAQIGHGGDGALAHAVLAQTSGNFGAIGVATGGGLTLAGGQGVNDYAQIGHGGFEFGATAMVSGGSLLNSGAITVSAAARIGLQGGGGTFVNTLNNTVVTSDGYVQIGHGGDQAFFGATLTMTGGNFGAISVATGGGLALAGGIGNDAYAQIGHGGFKFGDGATVSAGSLSSSGAITVGAASVSLLGGGAAIVTSTVSVATVFTSDGYAQIGHGGDQAFSGATLTMTGGNFGAIAVMASGTVSLAGGAIGGITGSNGYAQLGHGGFEFGDAAMVSKGGLLNSGAITLGATSLVLMGGGTGNYAQLGHGGASAFSFAQLGSSGEFGAISVGVSGGVSLNGGGGYAQIGHGGGGSFSLGELSGSSGDFGAIAISAGGAVSLNGGGGYAQIGHGGFVFGNSNGQGSLVNSGAITLGAASLALAGGGSNNAYAQIGHGGDSAQNSGNFGAITITASGAVSLVAGSGFIAYAQIGQGGANANFSARGSVMDSGAITLGAASLSLQGGTGTSTNAYVQIGNGGINGLDSAELDSGSNGNFGAISLTIGGGVVLKGGSGNFDYAQIGLGGGEFGMTAMVLGGSLVNSGAITLGAASVSLVGGSGGDDYAQIGHGGDQALTGAMLRSTLVSGNFGAISLALPKGGLTLAAGGGSRAYAQLGHGGFGFGTAVMSGGSLVDSGAITVGAASVSLMGGGSGTSATDAYAQIGHGAADGTARGVVVSGTTVDVRVLGTLALANGGGSNSPAFIGNRAASLATGSGVLVLAGALSDDGVTGIGAALAQSIAVDLAGGAVTVAVTGAADMTVGAAIGGTSGNQLNLVTAGNLLVDATIGNGSGGVSLVTGWDGHSGVPALANAAFTIAQAVSAVPEKAVMLAGTVTTSGGAVTALGAVLVAGAGAIDTTSGGASGAAIKLGRLGDASFEGGSLSLKAGTGSVTLGGGAGLRLGPLTIVSSGNVSLGTALAVETLSVTAGGAVTGNIDVAGTMTLDSISAAGSATLSGVVDGLTTPADITLQTVANSRGSFTFNGKTIP